MNQSTLRENNNIDGEFITAKELTNEIMANEDNYVYLQTVDDQFVLNYSSLFENKTEIANGKVYKVVKNDNNEIELQLAK